MCGICGTVRFDGLTTDTQKNVQRMRNKLIHRGPDNSGYYEDNHCALGFRRLSIIDLNTGNQPISNEDKTIWIVFNGEIYNFQELRSDLINAGHRFYTQTDTEVIVHAYEEYGKDFLSLLRGMFAFSIWDSNQQLLILARDRTGQKPLYYHYSKDGIVFGSELKALVQSPEVPREIDLLALDAYLAFGYVQSPKTILKGVNKLSPGTFLSISVSKRKIKVQQFWKLKFAPKKDMSEQEAFHEIRHKIKKAVHSRMVSDVPLGVLLSGGVDSTIVTGIMSQYSSQPVKTFSIGFDQDEYNELPYARMAAKRFETDHHELIVRPNITQIIPEVVYHLDEPMDDSSAIPTYYVAKMARQYVTVALNGDGGDEAFSGYERYGEILALLKLSKIVPRPLNRIIQSVLMKIPQDFDIYRFVSRARTFTEINHLSLKEFYLRIFQKWSSESRQYLYRPEIWNNVFSVNTHSPENRFLAEFNEFTSLGTIDKMLAMDYLRYLPADLLVKMDRMSMANSLETRSPFLDQKVIELAACLPESLKRRRKNGKIILKQAFSDLIPEPILQRPKKGFSVPLGTWFRNDLKDMLYNLLLSSDSLISNYFKRESLTDILKEHQTGQVDHTSRIWGLLVLELWQRNIW